MGRRTVWWRVVAASAALLCAAAALSGTARAAGTSDPDPSAPYAFDEDARTVEGATSTTGSVRLVAGTTYRSSLGADGKLYYRLELDGAADAYVSATAVPRPGTAVASSAGLKVSLQDADGHVCSSDTARFGPTRSPRPVTAWVVREADRDAYMCRAAGAYYVVVERAVTGGSSQEGTEGGGEPWELELRHAWEPPLKDAGATTAPPENWSSATPEAVTGDGGPRTGGTGFATASPVGQGVWSQTGGIRPGRTLYYKVPVDWGQQVYATAELGSADGGGDGFTGSAMVVSLYNPVRGLVDDVTSPYDGRQRSVALDPLPPVRYGNRHAVDDETSAMRFAGWYYLAVHLGEPVAERFGDGPFGLTLRVRVEGSPEEGPGYLGASEPRDVFTVTAEDREAAENGEGAGTAGEDGGGAGGTGGDEDSGGTGSAAASGGGRGPGGHATAMKVLAAGGIGTGSVLVLGLGLWTLVARRRAA
ncbi:hypothetical protein [Streptomyces poonensis]|uniref:Uncharacterized protein n=1 Tax=Streptomyces poonensis TaxID=68255 RepID=A0A918PJ51_9ACTN|nr:hypothetical protein [Streptomyces poonensis]GGZ12163.1 hypothetical protein GCM10010365_34750 [Streptomyces poonensis]GLJ93752.1 hypothetical protein GCM10017589_63680 [Streptomyces poonensis]